MARLWSLCSKACRQAFEHSDQSRAMGFTSSQPTQHGEILSQRKRRTRQRAKTWTGNINATHAPRIIDGPKAMDDERVARRARSMIRAMKPPMTNAALSLIHISEPTRRT